MITSYPLGEHAGGYVEVARQGIGLWPSTPLEKLSGSTLTDAEAISLMKYQVAYTGKYDVKSAQTPDGIKITIHVDAASNQALTGTNRVFYARVDGNKMFIEIADPRCRDEWSNKRC